MAKDEIAAFVDGIQKAKDDFSRQQGPKIERYLWQLSVHRISPGQFAGCMEEIKKEAQTGMRFGGVKARIAAQRIHDGVANLILGRLVKVLPD